MKRILKFLVPIVLAIVYFSCESNNQGAFVKLTFKAPGQPLSVKKSSILEDPVFDSAFLVIEKIELKKLEIEDDTTENEEKDEYNFQGPFLLDLLSGTSDPELSRTEIDPGMYSKAEAEFAYYEEYGFSVYLHGYFEQNNGEDPQVEFEYTYTQSEDFKVENPDGFAITADMINNVLILIDLNTLLVGVNFNEAVVDEDDVIRLNKESNRDLADIIEGNLEAASELGLDEDANGEIDD
jgi:hypothetical protein